MAYPVDSKVGVRNLRKQYKNNTTFNNISDDIIADIFAYGAMKGYIECLKDNEGSSIRFKKD